MTGHTPVTGTGDRNDVRARLVGQRIGREGNGQSGNRGRGHGT